MKLYSGLILIACSVLLCSCGGQQETSQPSAAAPAPAVTQAPVVEEKPQTKEERIQEINHYELIRGEFGGYEWGQQLSSYKKDGKIFFVLVEGASEGWSYTKRYYCDRDENLIQLLENEADGGEEVKGPGKPTQLNPAMPRIQDNIAEYLADVNFVLSGK